jgi:hypothetical protein
MGEGGWKGSATEGHPMEVRFAVVFVAGSEGLRTRCPAERETMLEGSRKCATS